MQVAGLRSLPSISWRPGRQATAGWHVILGDNGSGKSTFLRAMALAFVGPRQAIAARQEWADWLAPSTSSARILIELTRDAAFDTISGAGRIGDRTIFHAGVGLRKSAEGTSVVKVRFTPGAIAADRHIWGKGHGWFSAAYGPFRRFSGGDKETERIFLSNPKLGAHISVFGENVALTEGLLWLRDLHFKRLEKDPEGALLERLISFVNQPDFLPYAVRLKEVTSRGVEFEDANGNLVHLENLSDGYRSILSMTFELIRQLCRAFPANRLFSPENDRILAPGVVLIDEIDAHLHPTWQKRVGFWLVKHFPQIQFVVTTHSPLVCQAAVHGTIFRLANPGSQARAQMLEGTDRDRLLFGDILEAYSTEAFGTADTRSEASQSRQERLAELNNRELFSSLTDEERVEQEQLRSIFVLSPNQLVAQ